eukprot:scaffold51597_cov60-Phaeocystis_antarctica.AAC.3
MTVKTTPPACRPAPRGASLGGPYGAAKAHCCVAVDESRSSLAACCVSFYQLSVCLSVCAARR